MRVPSTAISRPIYLPESASISFVVQIEVIRSCIGTKNKKDKENAISGLGVSRRLGSRVRLYWSPPVWGNATKAAALISVTLFNEMGEPYRTLFGNNAIASFNVADHIKDLAQELAVPAETLVGPGLLRVGVSNHVRCVEIEPGAVGCLGMSSGSCSPVPLQKIDEAKVETYYMLPRRSSNVEAIRTAEAATVPWRSAIDATEQAYQFARGVAERVVRAKEQDSAISDYHRAAARKAVSQVAKLPDSLEKHLDLRDILKVLAAAAGLGKVIDVGNWIAIFHRRMVPLNATKKRAELLSAGAAIGVAGRVVQLLDTQAGEALGAAAPPLAARDDRAAWLKHRRLAGS